MLRVLALVPYPPGRVPGQRYRMEQWAGPLREQGIDVTFSPFLSPRGMDVLYRAGHGFHKGWATALGYVRRVGELLESRPYDVAYVYREAALLGPAWLERLHVRRRPLIFDFDDAIYLRTASEVNAWAARLKFPAKVAATCHRATRVIVGNDTLAEFARAHARDVSVIPSTVDIDVYTLAGPAPARPRPIVGWTGSQTTLTHLRTLGPALARLRREVDYELRVIGGTVSLDGVETTCLPWRAETEVEDLRPFDVGIMPLPDDEWSRGKCGMKAIQYMALGIPPVVSPVGFNRRLVINDVNGLHAGSGDEWVDALGRLLRDVSLRRRLGAAARQTVETTYSAQVQVPRVAAVLREAAGC